MTEENVQEPCSEELGQDQAAPTDREKDELDGSEEDELNGSEEEAAAEIDSTPEATTEELAQTTDADDNTTDDEESVVEENTDVSTAVSVRSLFNHRKDTIGGFIDEGLLDEKTANTIVAEWNELNPTNKTSVGRVNAQVRHLNTSHGMDIGKEKSDTDTTYTVEEAD